MSVTAASTLPMTTAAPVSQSSASRKKAATASSAIDGPERHCYCGDPSIQGTDLVCSINGDACFITHADCLRSNDGRKFHDYVLCRSCFLCAQCVRKPSFRHPSNMVCTLDSIYGCFYEMPQDVEIERGTGRVIVKKPATGASTTAPNIVTAIINNKTTKSKTNVTAPTVIADAARSTASPTQFQPLVTDSGALSDEDMSANSPEPKSRKRRSIRDTDKKKSKSKTMPRCTSPSHFTSMLSGAPNNDINNNALTLPLAASQSSAAIGTLNSRTVDKLRTDGLLSAVSSLYYRPRLLHPNGADVFVSPEYDRLEYSTLDMLLSPLRAESTLDDWSPLDIALFESGICAHGKDFHAIAKLMSGRKSCSQCVEFYYVWKKSSHYALWKECGKPTRKRHTAREQQWQQIKDMMGASDCANGVSTIEDTSKRRRLEGKSDQAETDLAAIRPETVDEVAVQSQPPAATPVPVAASESTADAVAATVDTAMSDVKAVKPDLFAE